MAIRTFLGSGDTFTAANNGITVYGASGTGTEKLLIQSGVTGITTDANIERIDVAGNLADYKFVVVAGTGIQIQNTTGTVIGTIPSLNQNATLAFADGSASLIQTGSTAVTLGGQALSTTTATAYTTTTLGTNFNTTVKSDVATTTPTTSTFTLSSNATSVVEGNNITFTVTLGAAQATNSTVNYTIAGTGGAILGTDTGASTPTAATGTLTFIAGTTTQTITIPTTADSLTETGEGVSVTLSSPSTGLGLGTTSSLTVAIADPAAGATYTLTQGLDSFTGNSGNDTFNAYLDGGAATLSSLDVLNGGDGVDTLNAFGVDLDNYNTDNISNIEKLYIQSTSAGTLDLSKQTAVTHITDMNSTNVSTYNNLRGTIELSVLGTSQAHVLNYAGTALTGTTDNVTLKVNGTTSILGITGLTAANTLETLTINSTGSTSTMELNDGGVDDVDFLTKLAVTGTAKLDIKAEALSVDTTTVDASAMTAGGVDILASAAGTTFTFTGSAANDTLRLGATLAATQTLNGGGGTGDTLVVTSAITTGETAKVTNFEVLGVDATGGAFTQDMDFFNVNIVDILVAGGNVRLDDVKDGLTINAKIDMGAGEDIIVNLKEDTASDDVTVNIGGTTGGIDVIGLNFDTRYELVTINSQGTATNTIADFGTALNNATFTGSTALTVTGTASLAGVADFSAMTGVVNATTFTSALTVRGGSANDALASGIVANGVTQKIYGNAGNDTITSGNLAGGGILWAYGGDGSDTITFNAANTGASVHYIDGGTGIDFITLGQHANTVDTVMSTVTITADADKITGFVTTVDDFDYNGTVKNDAATTITAVSNATLAGGLTADADATVYIVSTALTGAAAADMTALVAETTTTGIISKYATFESSLATALGTITGLDATLAADEYVLLNVDDGTNSVVLLINNKSTTVANTLTVDEIELVGIMVAADDLVTGDFI